MFIPPQGSRQGALRKAELKELGIDEFFIVQEEGEHRWALSLGVFRSEEAAQARLAALRTRACAAPASEHARRVVPRSGCR